MVDFDRIPFLGAFRYGLSEEVDLEFHVDSLPMI